MQITKQFYKLFISFTLSHYQSYTEYRFHRKPVYNISCAPAHLKLIVMSCQTCQVRLNGIDVKRHLHSDWHIYNLRRSLAALPPLSEELFLKKEEQFRLLDNANSSKSSAKTVNHKINRRFCTFIETII